MAEQLEAREKQTDTTVEVEHTHEEVTITKGKDKIHVDSHVFTLHEAGGATEREGLTREDFEGALDKVSRPLKGRLAHIPYSSDDLIRDKRADVEMEDRDS